MTNLNQQQHSLNPINMLVDAVSWNMLNLIRVELAFNCYRIWKIFVGGSLQSPSGQYAIISLLITLVAQLAFQFQLTWLLTIYSLYLLVGVCVWLKRRLYFYHRKLDSVTLNQTVQHLDIVKLLPNSSYPIPDTPHPATATLSRSDKHQNSPTSATSSATTYQPGGSITGGGENTNSLQRQRANAYRNFQSVLNGPRRNLREFALSLAHLSHTAKLVADKDVFDEMHFQLLATRRDVINLMLRLLLFGAASFLAYFKHTQSADNRGSNLA